MPFYDDTPNPDVIQRELVEATQAANQAMATMARARTELRNAEANYDAAKAKADELEAAYSDARGFTQPKEPAKAAAPAPAKAAAKTPAAGI